MYINPVTFEPFGPFDQHLSCGHVHAAPRAGIVPFRCAVCRQFNSNVFHPEKPGNIVDPVFYGTVLSWILAHKGTSSADLIRDYEKMYLEAAEELDNLRSTIFDALEGESHANTCKAFKTLCSTHLVNCAYAEPGWVKFTSTKPHKLLSSGKVRLSFFFAAWLYDGIKFWTRPEFAAVVTAATMEYTIAEMDEIELFVIGYGYLPKTGDHQHRGPLILMEGVLVPVFHELLRRFAFYANPPDGAGGSSKWICKKCKAWKTDYQPNQWFCNCAQPPTTVPALDEPKVLSAMQVEDLRVQVSVDVCDRLMLFTHEIIVKMACGIQYAD